MIERECHTCKYDKEPMNNKHCHKCYGSKEYPGWVGKDTKDCDTCKYDGTGAIECTNCEPLGDSYTEWKPKEETKARALTLKVEVTGLDNFRNYILDIDATVRDQREGKTSFIEAFTEIVSIHKAFKDYLGGEDE